MNPAPLLTLEGLVPAYSLPILVLLVTACRPGHVRPKPTEHTGTPPDPVAELDAYVADRFAHTQLPGLAVSVFTRDEVLYAGAFGMADLEEGREMTVDTPFLLASVSKPFTATCSSGSRGRSSSTTT